MSKIKWTGGAGSDSDLSGNFRNGLNWSGGVTPGSSDDVVLGGTGYTVRLAAAKDNIIVVNSIKVGAGTRLLISDPGDHPDRLSLNLSANHFVNNGSIKLEGTGLNGNYSDNHNAELSGWGFMDVTGPVRGKILATGDADQRLIIGNIDLFGSLKGSGTAEFNLGSTIEAGAKITVANLIISDLNLNADVSLTRSKVSLDGSLQTNGHTVTMDGGLVDGGQVFGGGTVHNQGDMTVAGLNLDGNFVNDGHVALENFRFAGLVSGDGLFTLEDGARVMSEGITSGSGTGTVASGTEFDFTTNGIIAFNDDSFRNFHGDIRGLGETNSIELDNSGFAAFGETPDVVYTPDAGGHSGTLALTSAHDHLSLHLLGDYATAGFNVKEETGAIFFITYQNSNVPHDAMTTGSIIHT